MEKHLRKSDYLSMPWKNGLGTTLELAVRAHDKIENTPDMVTDSSFLWRISIASVSEDGAFSYFPNIDRNLTILEGNGMVLDVAGQGELRLDAPLQSVAFSEEAVVSARLHDGPITDFNVMVDRRYAQARVEAFTLENEMSLIFSADDTYLMHVPEASSALLLSREQGDLLIESGESYLLEAEQQQVSVRPADGGAVSMLLAKITGLSSS